VKGVFVDWHLCNLIKILETQVNGFCFVGAEVIFSKFFEFRVVGFSVVGLRVVGPRVVGPIVLSPNVLGITVVGPGIAGTFVVKSSSWPKNSYCN